VDGRAVGVVAGVRHVAAVDLEGGLLAALLLLERLVGVGLLGLLRLRGLFCRVRLAVRHGQDGTRAGPVRPQEDVRPAASSLRA
jgi:hypothetical protein